MEILIIGGTSFLGRHLAETALARGHALTLFHRGSTGAELFPGARRILGDRRVDAARVAGGRWDAVIDTCAYHPRDLRPVLQQLAGSVGMGNGCPTGPTTPIGSSSCSAASSAPPDRARRRMRSLACVAWLRCSAVADHSC